jgi:sporulation protein YqfC
MDLTEKPTARLNKIEQLKQCHIQLEGNSELILDGCKGIMEYETDRIKICTDTVAVTVTGDSLTIRTFALEQIIISGKILSVDFS